MTNEERVVKNLKDSGFKFSGLYFALFNLLFCVITFFFFHWLPFTAFLLFALYGLWFHYGKIKEYKAENPCPLCGHEPERIVFPPKDED